jgi:hypothetical protein
MEFRRFLFPERKVMSKFTSSGLDTTTNHDVFSPGEVSGIALVLV